MFWCSVFVFINFKFLNLFVYMINGWAVSHIFKDNKIYISSNRLFNMHIEKFVCFENKGQCLVVSLQRTRVNWGCNLFSCENILEKLIFFSYHKIKARTLSSSLARWINFFSLERKLTKVAETDSFENKSQSALAWNWDFSSSANSKF